MESNLNTHFVPPPGFQSSPLDLQPEVQTVENGDKFSELQKDLFHPWTLAQNSSASDHLPLNNLFKANPSRTPDLPRTSDLFKGAELFQAAAQADKSPGIFMDPFKSPSNQANGLLQSSQSAVGNPFHTASASEADLFQAVPTNVKDNRDPFTKENGLFGVASEENRDLFSSSSTSAVDPFPSPVARDLFQDLSSVEDPFGPTPSKQHDPFHDVSSGTPDFFLPLPSKADSRDVFQTVPSNAAFSRPSFNCASETRLDPLMSPGLFRATESPPVDRPTTSSSRVVLTTPQGTKHAVLHPTPFSQARNLSVSPSQSLGEMTHVRTWYHWTCSAIKIHVFYTFFHDPTGRCRPSNVHRSLFLALDHGGQRSFPRQKKLCAKNPVQHILFELNLLYIKLCSYKLFFVPFGLFLDRT